jgi:Flp pilus assembly pilin Flp
MEMVKRFIRDEQGLETVEYAVILGLIVVAAIVLIGSVGGRVANAFQNLLNAPW